MFVTELDRTMGVLGIVSRVVSFTCWTSSLSFRVVDYQCKSDQRSQRRSKDQGEEVGLDIRERGLCCEAVRCLLPRLPSHCTVGDPEIWATAAVRGRHRTATAEIRERKCQNLFFENLFFAIVFSNGYEFPCLPFWRISRLTCISTGCVSHCVCISLGVLLP
jgi:hypothetical protein